MNEALLYLSRAHRARLLKIWRSAGWPHRDALDLDLLAADLLVQCWSSDGRESFRPSAAGMAWLADLRHTNRRAVSAHDRLAARLANKLRSSGRVVWRELSLRAQVSQAPAASATSAAADTHTAIAATTSVDPAMRSGLESPALWSECDLAPVAEPPRDKAWRLARPDLFSIRNTSVQAYLHPVVHEIKVSRADLLSDLRSPQKRQAYEWLCCECYYVFPESIASADEIPEPYGVLVRRGTHEDGALELLRPARHSSCTLPFAVWMALAQASPWREEPDETAQGELGSD